MNAFLIKLGKVWSLLRRDGIVQGSRRILASIPMFFHRVGSGEVLFIASGVGDSARYRCHHIAESLRLRGFRVAVTPQDTPYLSRFAGKFSVFVFHRTSWTPTIAAFVDRLKTLKKTVIFDTDDLVFDEVLFKQTAAYGAMNALERRQYAHGVGAEFLNDSSVGALTTSTEFLAKRLCVFGKPVFVLPNRLNREDVERADEILASNPKKHRERSESLNEVSIGYFSGSTGHDRDFMVVVPVLKRLLDEFSHLRLFIGGPLVLPNTLDAYFARIDRVSFVPRAENFKNIARVDINIAPLEIGDPFCEAKSELKFFEAGIVSVPTVASATQTFRKAISDGVDGFVAKDEQGWYERLVELICDERLRKRLGEKARETAVQKYITDTVIDTEYDNFLRARL
ncbi:MAG: glycosyltransferase [Candidatus Moraniibacteriota bacterium]|nr:MAG: glycosyltransferase [Candidatus Moranbacteria bacterium]